MTSCQLVKSYWHFWEDCCLSSKSNSARSLNCEVAGNRLLGNVGHSLPVNKALGDDMPQQLVATLSAEVQSQTYSSLYGISGWHSGTDTGVSPSRRFSDISTIPPMLPACISPMYYQCYIVLATKGKVNWNILNNNMTSYSRRLESEYEFILLI
jgi:hypothetical protein